MRRDQGSEEHPSTELPGLLGEVKANYAFATAIRIFLTPQTENDTRRHGRRCVTDNTTMLFHDRCTRSPTPSISPASTHALETRTRKAMAEKREQTRSLLRPGTKNDVRKKAHPASVGVTTATSVTQTLIVVTKKLKYITGTTET